MQLSQDIKIKLERYFIRFYSLSSIKNSRVSWTGDSN